MKRKISILASILILALVAGAVWIVDARANNRLRSAFVDESSKLSHYYKVSSEALKNGENRIAANELRKASSLLERSQAYADIESRELYFKAAREINDLAIRIDRREFVAENELRDAFADAHLAVAHDHRERAMENMRKKDTRMAAHELRLSADNLDEALKLTGREVGSTAVIEARKAADRLEAGADWTAAKVGDALESLGGAIESAGRRL